MCSINEIENTMYKYGNMIGLEGDSKLYPRISLTENVFPEGESIYIKNGEYHYVTKERGKIVMEHISTSVDEILFQVFSDITFSLATQYELENRKESEDFRRVLFQRKLELLGKINVAYKKREEKEIEKILEIAPYSS